MTRKDIEGVSADLELGAAVRAVLQVNVEDPRQQPNPAAARMPASFFHAQG